MKRIIIGLMVWLAAGFTIIPVAYAAPPGNISQTVGVCDPNYPKRCIAVAVDGSIAVTGGGGGGGGAVFGPTANGTAAANPPVLIGGTADATGTGTVRNAKVSASGLLSVDGSGVTQPASIASGQDVVEGATGDTSSTNTVFGNLQAIKTAVQATTAVGVSTCPVVGAACTQPASAVISIASNTTTQLVALSSGKLIYVYNFNVLSGGTGNFSLVYGTGSNCGTGTTALTGVYNLTAQTGLAPAGGSIPIFTVPASNALCVVDSASVQMSGSVGYVQQ